MKAFLSILGGMAMLSLLLAMPVRSEMVSVSDSDLSGISGMKNNELTFSGTSSTNITLSGDNSANIQVGWYQWNDSHDNDGTLHKGANDQSGTTTTVQQNVIADVNVINWGGWAQLNWVSGSESSSGTIAQMPYAVVAVGGF